MGSSGTEELLPLPVSGVDVFPSPVSVDSPSPGTVSPPSSGVLSPSEEELLLPVSEELMFPLSEGESPSGTSPSSPLLELLSSSVSPGTEIEIPGSPDPVSVARAGTGELNTINAARKRASPLFSAFAFRISVTFLSFSLYFFMLYNPGTKSSPFGLLFGG